MKTHQFITAFHYDDLKPSAELEKYCKEVNLKDVKEHNTSFFQENQEQLAKLLVPVIRDFWKEAGILHGYTGFRLKHIWIQHTSTFLRFYFIMIMVHVWISIIVENSLR